MDEEEYQRAATQYVRDAANSIEMIEFLLYSGKMSENINSSFMIEKLKQDYEKELTRFIESADAESQKRLLFFSDRFFSAIALYLNGQVLDEATVSRLKSEVKIIARLLEHIERKISEAAEQKRVDLMIRKKMVMQISTAFLLSCIAGLLFLSVLLVIRFKQFGQATGISDISFSGRSVDRVKAVMQKGVDEAGFLKKELERELFVSKRYRDILNSINYSIVVVSSNDEKILFINKATIEFFDLKTDFVGVAAESLFAATGIDPATKGKQKSLDKFFWLDVCQISDAVFYLIQDISEQEAISNKLISSERLISIGEMASKITHEIRNPLSTIKLNSEYLAENSSSLTSDELTGSLNLIIKEVVRLEDITGKYMGMVRYRAEEQKHSGTQIPQDLLEFLAFHKGELEKRNIVLEVVQIPAVSLGMALSSFKEVLLNIIKNAWEELPNGGKIEISANVDAKTLFLIIDDNGKGIEPQEREKIFRNFYTNKHGGTGIGLSHSLKLIQDAGGTISAHQSPINGARFIVEIPLKKQRQT